MGALYKRISLRDNDLEWEASQIEGSRFPSKIILGASKQVNCNQGQDMRAQIASLAIVWFALLSFSRSAAAQSNATSSRPPQGSTKRSPSDAKPLELPKANQAAAVPHKTHSDSDSMKTLTTWIKTLQDRKVRPGLESFGGGLDAAQCAHIRIFKAPDMDL